MEEFDPNSIDQAQLHKLRAAAEASWGKDTCHENSIDDPYPSAGQCYVTSRWLTTKLGGQVGVINGHYVWLSPDKKYVIDLTGDQFAYEPADPRLEGIRLDNEDEGHSIPLDHQTHRPGPVIYVRKDHPLYKGVRVKSFKTENPRVKLFNRRADEAYGR